MEEYIVKMIIDDKGWSIVYKTNTYDAAKVFLDGAYDLYGRKGYGTIEHNTSEKLFDGTKTNN